MFDRLGGEVRSVLVFMHSLAAPFESLRLFLVAWVVAISTVASASVAGVIYIRYLATV